MLDYLKKFYKPASAETQEEVEMTEIEKATLAAAEQKTAELTVALNTATATLTEKETAFAELSAKLEAAQAALNASEEAKAALAAEAATKRLEARTAAIEAAVGDGKAEALLAATDKMDDEQFNTIVSAMAASFDAEAKTTMFNEQGAAAETVVDVKPTHFNQFIKKEGN